MSRSLLAAVVAAFAALMPAAAWAQAAPTLTFDQPCYSPGDTMTFAGTGFTPGGAVNLFFNSLTTQQMGQFDATADAAGAITGKLDPPDPDRYLGENDWSGAVGVAANDRVRIDAGAPEEQQFAGDVFTLSRFEVGVEQPNGKRPKAGKPMRVTAVGYTNARGKTLYVHYRRNRKTAKVIKLGRLRGECGDRTRTLRRALPRGLSRGRYELVFNTSASDPNALPKQVSTLRLR